MQGRLPIRSELKPLNAHDLQRILTDTKYNLLRQQIALLETEHIRLSFTPDAVERIATIAHELNTGRDGFPQQTSYIFVHTIVSVREYWRATSKNRHCESP